MLKNNGFYKRKEKKNLAMSWILTSSPTLGHWPKTEESEDVEWKPTVNGTNYPIWMFTYTFKWFEKTITQKKQNSTFQKCPRFWPPAQPGRSRNPGVCSLIWMPPPQGNYGPNMNGFIEIYTTWEILTTIKSCPRFWPPVPPKSWNPGVWSHDVNANPPG